MAELKLSIGKLQTARADRESSGLRFVNIVPFVKTETITTDRLLITEGAVQSLNPPTR